MKTKGNWVIKTSGGGYWCGNSYFDPQLRKAQVYHWKEKAEEQIEVIKKRKYFASDMEYEIVAISEPRELKDTEAEWLSNLADECGIAHISYVCSVCGYSALNDYRGNPVASKFCPRCGKYMTNNDQPED